MRHFWKTLTANVVRLVATAGILLCMFCPTPTAAIENLKVVRGVLILEGKIEAGDYARVRNFLSDASNFKKMSGAVFLASQGGNVVEALQIGYLIRRLRLSTDAPSRPPPTSRSSGNEIINPVDLTNPRRYFCTSACFLLYVAGIYREFVWAGRLGLHHPQLERKPIGATEQDISLAAVDMRNRIKSYMEEMNVSSKYLDLMYSLPPNEVRWITQSELNADLKGYIPEVRALLDAKCNARLRPEDAKELHRCSAQVTADLRSEAWRKIFNRD
jgi:hypothetical protein